ncbi:MAG: diguanylate cyclase [Planctomycetes bacterium]|nr:diguanylate cyclase [Planctomycetota bacterium]
MPSMFAIHAVRHRISNTCELNGNREELIRLLQLDPPTVIRCLRIAGAPLVGLRNEILSIGDLVDRMGRSFVLRALRVPTIASSAIPTAVRNLWLHSISTAWAARDLASTDGAVDPERAYLLGLLRQAPQWIELLQDARTTDREFIPELADWNLPTAAVTPVSDRAELLMRSAELIAGLAEFPAPGEEEALDDAHVLETVTKEALMQAHTLRRSIHRELEEIGLDTTLLDDAPDEPIPESSVFRAEASGSSDDFIAGLLLCRQSSSYRAIVTVATSAALRYLDFERATYIAWHRKTNSVFIKSKADFTLRRLFPGRCELSDREASALLEALSGERPTRIARNPSSRGLLKHLGADEALVVTVNRDFETPTFLVLDRTLTQRAVDVRADATPAAVLCGTVAILTDNLLLRLQRIRAQQSAVTDPLTRLNNRAVGMIALEREMIRARREELELSVLMLDLDEFKQLNDTYGHLVGDQSLRMTANVLRRTLRRSDVLCRYGGEEFLVVLPATTAEDASILAARLFIEVENSGREYRLPLTVSIGLACLRDSDRTTDDLVRRADRALYASKNRGRNRFSVDIG